jgi:hypothetical protein
MLSWKPLAFWTLPPAGGVVAGASSVLVVVAGASSGLSVVADAVPGAGVVVTVELSGCKR